MRAGAGEGDRNAKEYHLDGFEVGNSLRVCSPPGLSAAAPPPTVKRCKQLGEGRGRIDGLATGLCSQSCEAELWDLGRKRLINASQPSPLYRTGRCGG